MKESSWDYDFDFRVRKCRTPTEPLENLDSDFESRTYCMTS